MKSSIETLQKILEEHQHIDIIIAQIDPDAVGASLGMKAIIEHLGQSDDSSKDTSVNIFFAGKIGHPQNRMLFNLYDLHSIILPLFFRKIAIESRNNHAGQEIKRGIALVDSCQVNDRRLSELGEFDPVIVVDHHRGTDIQPSADKYLHIEPVGAASTLVAEIWKELSVDGDVSLSEDDEGILTAMALGIYTDTANMTQTTLRDQGSYQFLTGGIDSKGLSELIDFSLPPSYFSNLRRGIANMERFGSSIVTGLGYLPEEQGDDVASAAEYLSRMEGISMVVAWVAVPETKCVRLSVRCSDPTIDLNQFMKSRFGKACGAKKTNGSVFSAGGGHLPFGDDFWLLEECSEAEALIQHKIVKRVKSAASR